MPPVLDQILTSVRSRVAEARQQLPLSQLTEAAEKTPRPRGFRRVLARAAESGVAIIAELKKASPSRGLLRGSYPVGRLALQFKESGAAALSVLTEQDHFQGALSDLREASVAGLPCLRKDFIVDEYQLYQARAAAADAVLLIASALADPDYGRLYRKARELGLDVLCEVHDSNELARTVAIGADMIGVNSRDLRTLTVRPENHAELVGQLPASVLRVAESGIKTGDDLRRLHAAGYQAFLIGEILMTADDPGATLAQLIADATPQ